MAGAHARCCSGSGLCRICPHPTLQGRIQDVLNHLRQLGEHDNVQGLAFPPFLLRLVERRRRGFNDGLIAQPTDPAVPGLVAARKALNLRGSVRVAVVLVDFADRKFNASQTPEHYKELFFSTDAGVKSVHNFYKEVSGGLVDVQGVVIGPLTAPRKLTEYANGHSGTGDDFPNCRTLATDVAKMANDQINFKDYDNDSDGYVDAFVFVHAGKGAEQTGNKDDIWSHKWVLEGDFYAADGVKVSAYLTVPADCRLGVCAHELGHLVFDWPDLYDIDYTSGGVGDWCLMGGGSWNFDAAAGEQPGDSPAHPSAWCKASQGWITVADHTSGETVKLEDIKTGRTAVRLSSSRPDDMEYYLLENRAPTKGTYDVGLPGTGMLVWHIDDSAPDNSNEAHYKVALVQADKRKDLERNANQGDASDPFPGTGNVRKVLAAEYGGRLRGVNITDISDAGAVMTITLRTAKDKNSFLPLTAQANGTSSVALQA